MRVGVDARALASPIRSGVEQYVVSLLRAMARLEGGPEVIAYADRVPPEAEIAALGIESRVQVKTVMARRGWLRVALPWRMWRDHVSVAHFPSTILPPILPCPAVVTVHDLAFRRYPETYAPDDLAMQSVALRGAMRAAHVIVVSESTAQDLVEVTGMSRDRITVIPLGVSEAFSPEGPGLTADAFPGAERVRDGCVLHTGGLHPRKNVARLLEAYALVKRASGGPHLVIAGDIGSKWGQEAVARAASLGIADDVIFPGQVGEAVLPALYRAAMVVVYPSLYEGFGLPILEAMASGAPVIISDRPSMKEVAGEAALLVDPESVQELAAAMERVLSDERVRQDLRQRGIARSREFGWERAAMDTVGVYRRAGSEPRR